MTLLSIIAQNQWPGWRNIAHIEKNNLERGNGAGRRGRETRLLRGKRAASPASAAHHTPYLLPTRHYTTYLLRGMARYRAQCQRRHRKIKLRHAHTLRRLPRGPHGVWHFHNVDSICITASHHATHAPLQWKWRAASQNIDNRKPEENR